MGIIKKQETINIEQEFFRVFGIEPFIYCSKPKLDCNSRKNNTCTKDCEFYSGVLYPEITAEKLLQLLCIVIDEYNRNGRTFYLDSTNVKELKEEILDSLMGCIDVTCDLFETEVNQVKQLFKISEEVEHQKGIKLIRTEQRYFTK